MWPFEITFAVERWLKLYFSSMSENACTIGNWLRGHCGWIVDFTPLSLKVCPTIMKITILTNYLSRSVPNISSKERVGTPIRILHDRAVGCHQPNLRIFKFNQSWWRKTNFEGKKCRYQNFLNIVKTRDQWILESVLQQMVHRRGRSDYVEPDTWYPRRILQSLQCPSSKTAQRRAIFVWIKTRKLTLKMIMTFAKCCQKSFMPFTVLLLLKCWPINVYQVYTKKNNDDFMKS